MALLSTLKSLLGIGGGADDRQTETTVTVEHDADDAVDEPGDVTADPETEPIVDDETAETDVDAETAVDETESAVEMESEPPVVDDEATDAAVEADAAVDADEGVVEADADSATEADDSESDAGDAYSDEPLDSIKGIGPAYSERLTEAGINSIAELAEGDAEEIGEAISVSPTTVRNWIDRAAET